MVDQSKTAREQPSDQSLVAVKFEYDNNIESRYCSTTKKGDHLIDD